MLGADQELHSDKLLQMLDRLTEWRLRHMQPRGGPTEVQLFGDRDELAE
jgi:hypothetical protein